MSDNNNRDNRSRSPEAAVEAVRRQARAAFDALQEQIALQQEQIEVLSLVVTDLHRRLNRLESAIAASARSADEPDPETTAQAPN